MLEERTIGKIGFDRIVISGFKCPEQFQVPIVNHCLRKGSDYEKLSDILLNKSGVNISKRGLLIYVDFFKLLIGNTPSGQGYVSLELRSARNNGDNIENMDIVVVKSKI